MQVHEIKREHALKKKKLVGRGGTRGKTSGRGGKGQTARAGHSVRPAMRDIIKKLPKLRGHGKNRAKSVFYRGPEQVVNVGELNVFSSGDTVTINSLRAHNLITVKFEKTPKVKILGLGEISVKLTVSECVVSASAQEKIEKAGGTVVAMTLPPVVEAMHAKEQVKAEAKAAKKSAKKEAKASKPAKSSKKK